MNGRTKISSYAFFLSTKYQDTQKGLVLNTAKNFILVWKRGWVRAKVNFFFVPHELFSLEIKAS